MSAEQQLLHDISGSICSAPVPDGKRERIPPAHAHHCILCAPSKHLALAARTPDFAIIQKTILRRVTVDLAQDVAPPTRPDLRATAPRGPPERFTA